MYKSSFSRYFMLLHVEESVEMVGLMSQKAVSSFTMTRFEESKVCSPMHEGSGIAGPVTPDSGS